MNGRRTRKAPAGKENTAPRETDEAAKAQAPEAAPSPGHTVIDGEATDIGTSAPAAGPSAGPGPSQESRGDDEAASPRATSTGGSSGADATREPPPETPEPPPAATPAEPPSGWARPAFGLAVLAAVLAIAALIWSHAQSNDAQQRIATLDSEIGQLQNTVHKLQSAPQAQPQLPQSAKSELAGLKSGLASAQSDIASLQSGLAGLQKKIASNQQAIAGLGKGNDNVPALAAAAARNAKLAAAALALEIGEPLGTIPGAPAALSRYADTAPPTLATLRASYPAAARKAEAAGGTAGSGKGGLWKKIRHRVTSLVTVRHGDTVLAGSLASGTLAKAQQQLDAGDLKAAVSTLDGLDKPAKAAMAGWLTRAQHLLAARAAIATMATTAGASSQGSGNAGASAPASGSGHA